MANIDCSSCEELREKSIDFATHGVTDAVCNSLKNDTGFSTKNSNNDCEDLDNANDCLIGMQENEIEKYEACDWQKFMHKFIPNLHQLLKTMICAICGIWTNIHSLWKNVNELWDNVHELWDNVNDLWENVRNLWKHMNQAEKDIDNLEGRMDVAEKDIDDLQEETKRIDCIVDYMSQGASFHIGESTSGDAYIVAGKGVSFLLPTGTEEHIANVALNYIAGGLMAFGGSLYFYNQDFTDARACGNYDSGSNMTVSRNRKGNSVWFENDLDGTGYAAGGELIYEIRIRRSAYPQIKSFYIGYGGDSYIVTMNVFNEGSYAYGQHGWCQSDGSPGGTGLDSGHLVPAGWTYLQLRLKSAFYFVSHNGDFRSPSGYMGVRMNQDAIKC